jgi:hypothetical protein
MSGAEVFWAIFFCVLGSQAISSICWAIWASGKRHAVEKGRTIKLIGKSDPLPFRDYHWDKPIIVEYEGQIYAVIKADNYDVTIALPASPEHMRAMGLS